LRQAILDANATPGTNEIDFAIAGDGVHTIRPIAGLPRITRSVTIDGTTQPGFAGSPLIEINGANLSEYELGESGLVVHADNCTLKGLVINGYRYDPNYGIEFTAGLWIEGSGNVVQGNYIGTDASGTEALGQDQMGVFISTGSNNRIGGTTASERNLISGNGGVGVTIYQLASGNVVQGNYIGTDVTGAAALGNVVGLSIEGSNNLVGGATVEARNLISGNEYGVVGFGGSSNQVQGNYIGTDVTGAQALGNGHDGVHINIDNNDTIGGEAPGTGNTIAFNGGDGVLVDRGTGNALLGNAIFANGNLGIELLHGGNHNQAPPVLTSATTDGISTTVTGTLSSTPNTTFTLEFFANSVNDPSGSGEQFLGSVVVTTDADGNASFTVTFAVAIDPGMFLTATATDSANNTSRFSAGVEVTP
jgi:hypothetical protein